MKQWFPVTHSMVTGIQNFIGWETTESAPLLQSKVSFKSRIISSALALVCILLFLRGKDLHPAVETWTDQHKYNRQEIGEQV